MDSKLNRQVSGVSSHTGKKRHHHKTNHSQSKPVNNLESHPLFQRRISRLHERKKKRDYFSWLQAVPDAFASIGKYLLPKKKQTDPNAPVLGVREIEQLRILSFSGSERRKLLMLFREMTGEKRNTASFRAFTRYFRLAPDVWAMRTFEIMNFQLSGAVNFLEFATFLVKYLVVDRASTEEFCFRLLSRRGITFMPEHSILDLEDFVTIVTFRYKEFSALPVQKKVALDIFSFVDADNDGGISVQEFRSFSAKNPVLLRMAHFLLNHLRKCIFGIDFWVEKSRIWKAKQPHSGVSLSLTHNRNAESELFFGQVLKEPVVDAAGAPLTNDFYIKLYEAKKRAEDEQRQRLMQQQELHAMMSAQNSLLGTNDSNSLDNNQNNTYPSKAPSLGSFDRSMSQSMMSIGNNSAYNNSVVSMHSQQRQGSHAMSREESFADSVDSQQQLNLGQQGVQMLLTTGVDTQTMLAQQKDYRTLNAFKAPYSLQKLLDHVTFAQDFPEIIKYRQEKRRERRQQEQLRREHIIQMKREAYVKLIKVCSDFVNRRRDIRYAFDTWLRSTGKESHAEVNAPHRSDLHRVDENLPADLLSLDEAGVDTELVDGAALYYGLSSDGMSSKDDLDSVTLSSMGDHRSHPHKKHHHKQHHLHHVVSQSPKVSDNKPVEQVVMLGDANNAMDRNSNISALSNDFFHHQSSMLSSSSLLGDDFDQNSIASGGHLQADWTPTAQLPPLPTSPIANSNFHDPYDKNRGSFFPEPLKPATISISSASSVSKHLQAAPYDSCPVSPTATSNTQYFTSSPFLDNPIARKQQLIQEEIQRASHPQRYTGRISDMHLRILQENDVHFAEKEVNAVDSFVEEYLNSRFFVPSKAEGRKSALPPPKPKSLESVESVTMTKTQQKLSLQQQQTSVSLSKTLPLPTKTPFKASVSSSPLAAASSLLLVKKKPLPNAGSTLDTKLLFLQQRATQAQKVLMSLDGEETIDA